MKKGTKALSLMLSAVILFTVLLGSAMPGFAGSITAIRVNPNQQYQTFEGWGTSLAWFGDIIGGWSDAKRNEMADLLFDADKGLGLNIARYNIGGGDDPSHDHMRPGGAVPGYKESEQSGYDWTADENQRWVLQAAKERAGSEFIAEAFSNSPPYWMTVSGCASGNTTASENNLKDEYYDDFADYLTEVVKHFKDEWGITFRTLDPLNEPNTSYWRSGGRQEGCHFGVDEQALIIKETYAMLESKGLLPAGGSAGTEISAMDETSIDLAISNFNGYDADTKSKIAQINTHTYGGSQRLQMKALAEQYSKKLWMSEVGIGGSVGHDHEAMNPALQLAQKITDDVAIMGPEAWVYWQVVEDEANMLPEEENSNWGFIHADFDGIGENYYMTKQYYTMANYSKFIRPGHTIIESGNGKTLAAYDKDSGELVLVVVNSGSEAVNYRYDLSEFKQTGLSAKVYRTSGTENLKQLSDVSVADGALFAGLPAESVTTYVISGMEFEEITSDPSLLYYVDCGDADPGVVEDGEVLGVMNSVEEQVYGADPVTGYNWGYTADDNLTWARSDALYGYFDSLRQFDGTTNGKGLHYMFEIPNGTYKVVMGFKDPWGMTDRYQDIAIEGNTVESSYLPTSSGEIKEYTAEVNDGELTIDILKAGGSKPIINWIRVETAPAAPSIQSIKSIAAVAAEAGTAPVLPEKATLNYSDGSTSEASVLWDTIDPASYADPGMFAVSGTVDGMGLVVSVSVTVYEKDLIYYVDCGPDTSEVFDAVKAASPGIRNTVTDQAYGVDSGSSYSWGYACYGSTGTTTGSDQYSTLRYDEGNTAGEGITYSFEVPNGAYDVRLGFQEIWSNSGREMDIVAEGDTRISSYYTKSTPEIKSCKNVVVEDGVLDVEIIRSADNTGDNEDPVISWISVSSHVNSAPVLAAIGDKSVNEGSALEFTVTAEDEDLDELVYSVSGLPSGAVFDLLTGEFSWTPDFSQQGAYEVTFTVKDVLNEEDSETISIEVVDVSIPPVPSGFSSQKTGSMSILMKWNALSSAETYMLFKSQQQADGYELLYEGQDTAYLDMNVAPNTTYYYKIQSKNAAGQSELSSYVAVTTLNTPDYGFTEQELEDNDYIVYFVNAGDPTPGTVEDGDKMGLYASSTEQMYQTDAVTGRSWGLETTTTSTSVSDATSKFGSLRYYSGSQVRDKAVKYRFELPEGYYNITVGFKNPWSGRSVNILAEGTNLTGGDYEIGSYGVEKQESYNKIYVYDGELNISIQGPSTATLSQYNDPMVSFIIIQKYYMISAATVQAAIDEAKQEAQDSSYSPYSLQVLNEAISKAEAVLQKVTVDGEDIESEEIQAKIRECMEALAKAMEELAPVVTYGSFTPGQQWQDTDGALIQAHGGGILYDELSGKYYWYGEDKTNGYLPARGVRCYSSTDLYNWKDEGLALTAIESEDQFDTDTLISQLYAGRSDREDILNDIGTDRVIERPKVIYNELTGKYVMWMHTDGPTETSTANYAKAEVGYALSDSPTGPFVYQQSNRMDRCPEDAEYNGQPDEPGMARDMTLFKDDDGTAYIIYSSEENMTMYISKLNETYTDVVGWHRDGNEERDTEYKAVYGEDYVRVFPGAQREAPAVFKYMGKYYMITSGATGWSPNSARYTVADSMFGEWRAMRNPCEGEKASTTFDSQSTYVIPVDPDNGKFIYMGDRWNESDLKNSRYVWLPIDLGQDDEIAIRWYDEWGIEVLDGMNRVTIDTELPDSTALGVVPALPVTVDVTTAAGDEVKNTPIVWDIDADDFSKPGEVKITGRLTAFSDKIVAATVYVIPENVQYFVHCGGAATPDYIQMKSYMQDTIINKNVIDQKYSSSEGQKWGYVGDVTKESGDASGDMFSSLRYLLSSSGDDLSYTFEIGNGSYQVYVGLYDPWYQSSAGNRKANILINGETKTSGYIFTDAYDVLEYNDVSVTGGVLDVTVRRSSSGNSDPQISWIIISGTPDQSVDKSSLGEAIDMAGLLNQNEYTAGTWAVLQQVLAEAVEVYDSGEATQAMVDSAEAALWAAVQGLELAETQADRSVLLAVINSVQTLSQSDYTAGTWAALQQALEEAEGVYGSSEASQAEIDSAVTALQSAVQGLETVQAVNLDILAAVIDMVQALSEANYTAATWEAMQQALAEAIEVYGSGEATQAMADGAASALQQAIQALELEGSEVNKDILGAAIGLAQGLSEGNYTAGTWAVLQQSLAEAIVVYDSGAATQAEADSAASALQSAVQGLETVQVVNRAVLAAAIATAQALNGTAYTAGTWAVLQQSLAEAIVVYDSGAATQAEVDSAVEALHMAVQGLETAPVVSRAALVAAISAAYVLNGENYTPATWQALQQALTEALSVYRSSGATQQQIDAAREVLSAAIDALEVVTPVMVGGISGTVTNASGSPISGAYVKAESGGLVYSAVTGSGGGYTIENIPEGEGYTVTASKTGYYSASVTGIAVASGETATGVDMVLRVVSSGSSSSGSTKTSTSQPNVEVTDGVIKVMQVPTVDAATGEAKVDPINESDLSRAFDSADRDSQGIRTVSISIPESTGATAYAVELPAWSLVSGAADRRVEIETALGTIQIPSNMMRSGDASQTDKIEIVIAQADVSGLDESILQQLGSRPVLEVSIRVNGRVIAWKNLNTPVTVRIPYDATEQELEAMEYIAVWYLADDGSYTAMPSARYIEDEEMVVFETPHLSKYAVAFVKKSFNDIEQYPWIVQPVQVLASKGVIEGIDGSMFGPDTAITRGEFTAWLVRTLGLTAEFSANFSDVGGEYAYYEEIGIARILGISKGGGSGYSPDKQISRQDMMVLTVRALKAAGNEISPADDGGIGSFADADRVAKYARADVAAMLDAGFIKGSGSGSLNPEGTATRAEAAQMLYRIYSQK